MKFLVTGAMGYLGARLANELSLHFPNTRLILLDNLSVMRREVASPWPKAGNYDFVRADIRTFDFHSLGLRASDGVIHLAALSHAGESFARAKEYEEVNGEGTGRVAEACARASAFLFFPSTTSIYAKKSGWVTESSFRDIRPQSPYAASKLQAEKILSETKGLRYLTARFGTLYGPSPRMSFHTVVHQFCRQAAAGEPLTVWKTAWNQCRPYLDIEDAVRFILFVIQKKLFKREACNVVGENLTARGLVEKIRHFAPSARLKRIHARAMNEFSYRTSTARMKRLGFECRGRVAKSVSKILEIAGTS